MHMMRRKLAFSDGSLALWLQQLIGFDIVQFGELAERNDRNVPACLNLLEMPPVRPAVLFCLLKSQAATATATKTSHLAAEGLQECLNFPIHPHEGSLAFTSEREYARSVAK